jgi:hypothetical protein
MGEDGPRVRRRGFFLHSDTTGETEHVEMDNPEGFVVRTRAKRSSAPRRATGGRSHSDPRAEESRPQIRSGSVTGSRQRSHLPR